MSKKAVKEIDKHNDEMSVLSSADRLNRARSVTVGTTFNGVSEIVMRTDGKYIFAVLQPTEVIELIHQLAANVGCHIHIQPRNDFASWRQWRDAEHAAPPVQSFPPFANHPPLAQEKSNSEYVQAQLAQKGEKHETMAIEKSKNRRNTQRAAKAS